MSTTAPTQRPQVDDATRAADLLATVRQWHATHPQNLMAVPPQLAWMAQRFPVRYEVTEAGKAALAPPTSEEGAA